MESLFDIKKIIKKGKIENELEFERALVAERKLRILAKDNLDYKILRKNLRDIIAVYETNNWSQNSNISNDKIKESDLSALIAEKEREFIEKRKAIIKSKLEELSLKQQDLGIILGHKSKTHISELMNGFSPFSLKDLIILSRVLKLEMKYLIPMFLSTAEQERIKAALANLNKPDLRLSKEDLVFI